MRMFHIITITCIILVVICGTLYWNGTKDLCKDIQIKEFNDGCKQGISVGWVAFIIGSIAIWSFASLINKLDDNCSKLIVKEAS